MTSRLSKSIAAAVLALFAALMLAVAAPAGAQAEPADDGLEAAAAETLEADDEGGLVPQATRWSRLAGGNRYQTMQKISQAGFAKASWAVIATGANFPDALMAASLAGARNCPVILTAPHALSPEAHAELVRLGVRNAYIVGGTSAVSTAAENAIRGMGIAVTRVAGADRQLTSIEAMNQLNAAGVSYNTVVIATGGSFADALSIGPWCYQNKAPILLTGSNGLLSSKQVAAVHANSAIKRILIVGGESVVSDAVYTQLGHGYTRVRLSGTNRYATSYAIATWELAPAQGMTLASACVATGTNFPDALAGSALAGQKKSVLLLAKNTASGRYAVDNILAGDAKAQVKTGRVLGGVNVVPQALLDALNR